MSIDFIPGDYVDALGQPAKIVDVLSSKHTENMCVFIRFARNFGNARPFDMIEFTPDKMQGVNLWTKINRDEYMTAIQKRLDVLQNELIDG